ncbi:hypothetical protein QOT17_007651 [Balamuthia mandrillaris]
MHHHHNHHHDRSHDARQRRANTRGAGGYGGIPLRTWGLVVLLFLLFSVLYFGWHNGATKPTPASEPSAEEEDPAARVLEDKERELRELQAELERRSDRLSQREKELRDARTEVERWQQEVEQQKEEVERLREMLDDNDNQLQLAQHDDENADRHPQAHDDTNDYYNDNKHDELQQSCTLLDLSLPSLLHHPQEEAGSSCLYSDGRYSLKCQGSYAHPNRFRKPFRQSDELTLVGRKVEMVALASRPRSGNSWVRFLVEAATGIVTEAVYSKEGAHRTPEETWYHDGGHSGLCDRTAADGQSALIKTHEVKEMSQFGRAIRLVRFPLDLEPWYRFMRVSSHDDPFQSLVKNCENFVEWHQKWNCFTGEQLVVRYEDLMQNTECVLRRILDFLDYSYTPEDIQRAIQLYPPSHTLQLETFGPVGLERKPGWDVPLEFLAYAKSVFYPTIVHELGYQDLMKEVDAWIQEKS